MAGINQTEVFSPEDYNFTVIKGKKIAVNHHGELNASGSSEDGEVFNVFLPMKLSKMEV